jgi:hypothetical protein
MPVIRDSNREVASNLVVSMPGVRAVVAGAHLQRHHQLLQRRVAGALADAVDGAFDLARTALDRGQRVRDRQAQVVVAVRAEDHAVGAGHVGAQVFEQLADFFRRGDSPRCPAR